MTCDFYARYVRSLPNVRLLEISLPEPCLDEFLKENQPLQQNGESGVFTKLSQRVGKTGTGIVRGFDILGDRWSCGSFQCFTCHGLEKDYTNELGIRLNEYGLVPNYDAAVKAAEYTNLESTGADPVLWQPWMVTELPLVPTR